MTASSAGRTAARFVYAATAYASAVPVARALAPGERAALPATAHVAAGAVLPGLAAFAAQRHRPLACGPPVSVQPEHRAPGIDGLTPMGPGPRTAGTAAVTGARSVASRREH